MESNSSDKNDNSAVNVMIYDGNGVMDSSVAGIEDCLNDSNNQNISQHILNIQPLTRSTQTLCTVMIY